MSRSGSVWELFEFGKNFLMLAQRKLRRARVRALVFDLDSPEAFCLPALALSVSGRNSVFVMHAQILCGNCPFLL